MQYVSTRGQSPAVSASAAIVGGLAPDGGLYVPQEMPRIDLNALLPLSYAERAVRILGEFLTDFTEDELRACVKAAYTPEKFGDADPTRIKALSGGRYVLELWHGPTCAFKDMALQILPHLLTASLRKQGEKRTVTVLVATSGDTGKAALEGFCDAPGTRIMVFYPSDGVSDMQKRQMITQKGSNVCVRGIKGNFDDAQNGVKALFADAAVAARLDERGAFLSSANSINFGRLAPQIVYYIDAYLKLVSAGAIALGEPMDVCVPTGNFGNILAAYMAYRMGLPVRRFLCASNRNDVLTEFIRTGRYDRRRTFYVTSSPSMDILISSNLERLLWYLTGDPAKVRGYMEALKSQGHYTVDAALLEEIQALFDAESVDEAGTAKAIAETRAEGYLIDPHTAVAVGAAGVRGAGAPPMLIASTASPFKFAYSVLTALGVKAGADGFADLARLAEEGMPCPDSLAALKNAAVRFPEVIGKEEMEAALFGFVK